MPLPADPLQFGARALGLELETAVRERLQMFADLVRSANRAFNLVSRHDISRLESRHILDSLALGMWMNRDLRIGGHHQLLDIGSGGGFPGMILAILWPGTHVTLLDRSAKKTRFLERSANTLGLANVEVKCHDVEAEPLSERFDFITSRAVAPVSVMWPWVSKNLCPDGVFVHMSYVVDATHSVKISTGPSQESVVLDVPGLDSRHVITVIRNDRVQISGVQDKEGEG